eukprot:1627548-Amphidinium_carterae.1
MHLNQRPQTHLFVNAETNEVSESLRGREPAEPTFVFHTDTITKDVPGEKVHNHQTIADGPMNAPSGIYKMPCCFCCQPQWVFSHHAAHDL